MVPFTLRPWQRTDAEAIAEAANNPSIAANLRNVFPSPYTLADAEWYVGDCIAQDGEHQLTRAVMIEGKAVGSIGVFVKDDVYEKSAELGYWLAEAHWGQGVMTEAVRQIAGRPSDASTSSASSRSPLRTTGGPGGCWKRQALPAREPCAAVFIKMGGSIPIACMPS